ncbi:hypothetical protein K8I61_06835 [bacterium]|nr:hypothetical protein [bacterium]
MKILANFGARVSSARWAVRGTVALAFLLATGAAGADEFSEKFWPHWGDGKAELCGYGLTYPRYGESRNGRAVAIFVTETFSKKERVKAETTQIPPDDRLAVMKLNLVKDFQTGIYDYNMMTSAFVALEAQNGRPRGAFVKSSFSSQEWCGHVYAEINARGDELRHRVRSYFFGESHEPKPIPRPANAILGDELLIAARGFFGDTPAGDVPYLPSSEHARVTHTPLAFTTATITRESEATKIKTPAGEFSARAVTFAPKVGPATTVYVETAWPHRVVKWETTDGEAAILRGSTRLPYWKLNAEGGEKYLKELGLEP